MPEFSSEGFDLDALASAADDAVLELGGKVVTTSKPPAEENEPGPLKEAESLKQQGNDAFKQKDWQHAYELYSKAIAATPGMKGSDLLKAQHAWQEEQNQKMREQMRRENLAKTKKTRSAEEQAEEEEDRKAANEKPETFVPPPHPHGPQLAVYYSNRAAASMQLAQQEQPADAPPPRPRSAFDDPDDVIRNPRLEEAVNDCSIALLLNPVYCKAWVRRSTAHERLGDTESALKDAREALRLEPYNASVGASVVRLQKLEDERLERLKTETIGKLKDLGNSILGNFGLSLDNFNARKDPNTGSYSISFNQGNGSSST